MNRVVEEKLKAIGLTQQEIYRNAEYTCAWKNFVKQAEAEGFPANSGTKMTKREYLKYNNPEAFDMLGKPVKVGDTVVINNNYYATPIVGVVDHFTESGNIAVMYDYKFYRAGKLETCKCWAYRFPRTIVKLKNGNRRKV